MALFMAIILGTVGFRFSNPASGSPEATSATQELGPGTLTTLTGQVIDVDTLGGRVILVNAWATWCGPCIQEMPGFQRVQDELKDEGFLVLGMAGHDMGPEYVSAFLRDLGITYPVTLGPQRPLDGLAGQVRGIPTSFLLDRYGQLVRRVEGLFPENALRTAVRKLLTEDPPKTPRIDHVG